MNLEELAEQVDALSALLERDRWIAPLYGGLPTVPVRDTLPAATADLVGKMIVIRGGSGVADVFYVCLLSSAGTPDWRVAATG